MPAWGMSPERVNRRKKKKKRANPHQYSVEIKLTLTTVVPPNTAVLGTGENRRYSEMAVLGGKKLYLGLEMGSGIGRDD